MKSIFRGMVIMMSMLMTVMMMGFTASTASGSQYLRQSLATAMYQSARDVVYSQTMEISTTDEFKAAFEARLAGMLPAGTKNLRVKYYKVVLRKPAAGGSGDVSLLSAKASYDRTFGGETKTISSTRTITIQSRDIPLHS